MAYQGLERKKEKYRKEKKKGGKEKLARYERREEMTDSFTRRAALRAPAILGLAGLLSKASIDERPRHKPGLVPQIKSRIWWPSKDNKTAESKAARRALGLFSEKNARRIGGLDPDLASLKSVSPAMKRLIQMNRIVERYDWIEKLESISNTWIFDVPDK